MSNIFGKEILFFNALSCPNCIEGPSAIGSENGTPTSIISTPEEIKFLIIFSEESKSGSPATE